MTLFDIPQNKLSHYIATNKIIGLAIDQLPSGRFVVAEVRQDEDGVFHSPYSECDWDSNHSVTQLAHICGLPILPGELCTKQQLDAFRSDRQATSLDFEFGSAAPTEPSLRTPSSRFDCCLSRFWPTGSSPDIQNLEHMAKDESSGCREYSIGLAYCIGDGVPQDLPGAFKWYSEAAEKGCVDAKFSLGMCYEHGKGVDVDILSAASWYWSAATDGHQEARRRLDTLVASDIHIKAWRDDLVDDINDLFLLDSEDQFGFALAYSNGDEVEKDLETAVKWYMSAADSGHAGAQNNLGICYDRGEGVPQDRREAAKWYRLAADQGDETAQFNLGLCHVNGTGVPKDMVLAYKWFNLAAANGHKGAAEVRDEIEGKMLSSQVAEAQKLSRQFPR